MGDCQAGHRRPRLPLADAGAAGAGVGQEAGTDPGAVGVAQDGTHAGTGTHAHGVARDDEGYLVRHGGAVGPYRLGPR